MSAAAEEHRLPPHVGRHSREVDVALPGKHTTKLYNQLKKDEASILAQLRTGATRLNSYLHKIGRAESDLCPCGSASETIEHFLFRCSLWNQQRLQIIQRHKPKEWKPIVLCRRQDQGWQSINGVQRVDQYIDQPVNPLNPRPQARLPNSTHSIHQEAVNAWNPLKVVDARQGCDVVAYYSYRITHC